MPSLIPVGIGGDHVGPDGTVDSVRRHRAGGAFRRYRFWSRNRGGLRRPTQLRLGHLSLRRSQCRWHLPHPGDGNGRADLTPATADQVVGVRRLVVPVVGLPINWYSAGAWVHLVAWLTVLSLAVLATRYALLEGHDPWMNPELWTYASG